jgi:hypothetical protein
VTKPIASFLVLISQIFIPFSFACFLNFFGASVGSSAGAAVGGAIGSIADLVTSLFD